MRCAFEQTSRFVTQVANGTRLHVVEARRAADGTQRVRLPGFSPLISQPLPHPSLSPFTCPSPLPSPFSPRCACACWATTRPLGGSPRGSPTGRRRCARCAGTRRRERGTKPTREGREGQQRGAAMASERRQPAQRRAKAPREMEQRAVLRRIHRRNHARRAHGRRRGATYSAVARCSSALNLCVHLPRRWVSLAADRSHLPHRPRSLLPLSPPTSALPPPAGAAKPTGDASSAAGGGGAGGKSGAEAKPRPRQVSAAAVSETRLRAAEVMAKDWLAKQHNKMLRSAELLADAASLRSRAEALEETLDPKHKTLAVPTCSLTLGL